MPFDGLLSESWPAVARSNASTSIVVLPRDSWGKKKKKSSLSCKYQNIEEKKHGALFIYSPFR